MANQKTTPPLRSITRLQAPKIPRHVDSHCRPAARSDREKKQGREECPCKHTQIRLPLPQSRFRLQQAVVAAYSATLLRSAAPPP